MNIDCCLTMSDRLLLGLRPHLILIMVTFTVVNHRRPFVQASHVVRRAHGIYATSANNMDIGERNSPFNFKRQGNINQTISTPKQ
jgi:hypothetical protein